ncbi:hypothetical protein MMC26_004277 [Xylographa opegraphella]|nr:hypothetical protein [Xylographa opegraphella]
MNRLHVNTTFGRSKPLVASTKLVEAAVVSSRPFHISAVRPAGEESPAARPPFRSVLQNQVYSQQVQNLAQSASQNSNTTFRPLVLDRNKASGGVFDARHLASQPGSAENVVRRASPTFRGGQASGFRGGRSAGGFQRDKGNPEERPSGRGTARRGRGDRRARGNGEPRRRGRGQGSEGAGETDGVEEDDPDDFYGADEDLMDGYVECEEEWNPSNKPHSFHAVEKVTLVGKGPSLAVGEWGMSEIVEEKLEQVTRDSLIDEEIRPQVLAKRLVNGRWVRFRDDEERDSVAGLAKSRAEQNAVLKSERKGEVVEPFDTTFQTLSPEQTEEVTRQLLMGSYDNSGLPPAMKDIAIRVRKSGAISQQQEDSLVKKINSPADLYRLISASPVSYQVFTDHKVSVLAAVVQNAIPREVLSDALAACDASAVRKVSSGLPRNSEEDLNASATNLSSIISRFVDDYQRRDYVDPKRLRDPSLLTSLCRLWATVDFFISGYKNEAMRQIHERLLNSGHSLPSCDERSEQMQELSKPELCRLQRAFFRYEIYRKLFTSFSEPYERGPVLSADAQARLFLCKFPDWEQEELACVFDYLMVHAQDCFDKLEDDFVETVHEGANSAKDFETLGKEEYIDTVHINIAHFMKWQKSYDHRDLLLWIVGLGLPYLKKIDELNQAGRLNLIAPFAGSFLIVRTTIDVVKVFRQSPRAGGERSETLWPDANSPFTESITGWNMGWVWARASGPVHYYTYRPQDCTIVSMGYVFWDESRLRDMGVLNISRHSLKETPRRSRKDMPSVEERLKGVPISEYLLEHLGDEYEEFNVEDGWKPDLEAFEY